MRGGVITNLIWSTVLLNALIGVCSVDANDGHNGRRETRQKQEVEFLHFFISQDANNIMSMMPASPPTREPTTQSPSSAPKKPPTESPVETSTSSPTVEQATDVTSSPVALPTLPPSHLPTLVPSEPPSEKPINLPISSAPVTPPSTETPSLPPVSDPTRTPTAFPTVLERDGPTNQPTPNPTRVPDTESPTSSPTSVPNTDPPTPVPTSSPSMTQSSVRPSLGPTHQPTAIPTRLPTFAATEEPSQLPTVSPTNAPTTSPVVSPTVPPTGVPTELPSPVVPPLPTGSPSPQPTFNCNDIDRFSSGPIEETVQDVFVDVDNSGSGFSTGDIFIFENNVLETSGIGSDGRMSGRCVVLEDLITEDFVYCTINQDFPEGSVALQGVFLRMTMVGGDGCNTGISGIVETERTRSNDYLYSYEIEDSIAGECPAIEDLFENVFDETWEETRGDTLVDVDLDGSRSIGDLLIFDSNQITAGSENGTVAGECIQIPNSNTFCFISYEFDSGTITATGVFDQLMVFTGGTGCFYGLTGTVVGDTRDEGTYEYVVAVDGEFQDFECTSGEIFDTTWLETGEDVLVDFDRSGDESPGDGYVFDGNIVRVGDTGLSGLASGFCSVMTISGDTFCTITLRLDEGVIALQGFFADMLIVAGSGCFRGLHGRALGSEISDTEFEYEFILE